MYQEERLLKILDYLKTHNQVSNQEICSMLDISRDTARRDIIKLVEEETAIRTHGGIALPHFKEEIKAYKERLTTASKQKYQIGKEASTYIMDGDLCFLDVSTTIKFLCEHLKASSILYTHSLDNAEMLSTKEFVELNILGGNFNQKNRFFYGPEMISQLNDICFDKVFLGSAGISSDGIYYADEEDAYIKKIVSKRAKQVFLLADYEKFNHTSYYKAMSFLDVDTLITDKEPPGNFIELLNNHGVQIELVREGVEN
ncbi:HTH-type transcriptional repressor GlcR [Paraliobacillus ryukyuensis]|uniref:DeoR family transcriptional regulator n=1 Tax=Paraliobacillus ryukyuensis TaxID=200904 RepID=A0A366EH04_9BACI|nr:DeoR/GlpR family DNA-binding transcription regulator [Paraliobacillus ryukyuensis]RBP01613.1 DeoR family transcriptional regulator [Paraliobacillus ryukyuensis]